MACVENIPPRNVDSEMEEGEIIDDIDELSDISSEEEFLLRQRLQVLENYNNVLERKKAKSSFITSGKRKEDVALQDLSEISGTEFEDNFPQVTSKASVIFYKNIKEQKHVKPHQKQKKKKDIDLHKEHRKKVIHKKKFEAKTILESSEESDDEYRNKRRKLANAVIVNKDKNDKTTLQDRLQKMLSAAKVQQESLKTVFTADKETEIDIRPAHEDVSCSPIITASCVQDKTQSKAMADDVIENARNVIDFIDLCADDSEVIITSKNPVHNKAPQEQSEEINKKTIERDSDEDLEALRQHALKTKSNKKADQKIGSGEPENKSNLSDDEDSDTAELRLICLKSALLKKAIERKQRQKLKKKLSQSSSLQDELFNEQYELMNKIECDNNNTDIESVDMDIGSDGDEKGKDISNDLTIKQTDVTKKDDSGQKTAKEDELEEDEDLLRAKLLTSLSKNLPNLVDPTILNYVDEVKTMESKTPTPNTKIHVPEEKRIVINLGESDSEGEHEATKNLTKMHMKLSEQIDFQQKLDSFLKSARMEVEKTELPDIVGKSGLADPAQKFVPKAVNHLPKSEQIEYRNLVKRMKELGRLKQARNTSLSLINNLPVKETLKPRNASNDFTILKTNSNILEEHIAKSRKIISEESAKLCTLKEEATKLSQKYKIVATELRNIGTAIALNKKQQRSVQNRLYKIRQQHQKLINSSFTKHSKTNGQVPINCISNKILSTKLQKENDPTKEECKHPQILKSVKVTVANDTKEETLSSSTKLSVKIDVATNKKTIKTNDNDNRVISIIDPLKTDTTEKNEFCSKDSDSSLPLVEKGGGHERLHEETGNISKTETKNEFDDYKSPLQALGNVTWEADPNAILCPFEVDGSCKDPDCKYLHPKLPIKQ